MISYFGDFMKVVQVRFISNDNDFCELVFRDFLNLLKNKYPEIDIKMIADYFDTRDKRRIYFHIRKFERERKRNK